MERLSRFHRCGLMIGGVVLLLGMTASTAGQGIVIDHTCSCLESIPSAWIDAVKSDAKIHYAHTSHGSQIDIGLDLLEAWNSTFDAEIGYCSLPVQAGALCIFDGQEFDDYVTPDLYWQTPEGLQNTRDVLDHNPELNASMWAWCTQLDYYSTAEVQEYLDAMGQLEAAYPMVRFVYFTGNAQATGEDGYNRFLRNRQIRQYCQSHGKILFDFEDLDSWWYDPVASAWEQATYSQGGQAVPVEHPQFYGDNGGHTNDASCLQKGRAYWWLLARLRGWEGETGCTDAPSNLQAVLNVDTHSATLSWQDNSADEDGFIIQRRGNAGGWDLDFHSVGADVISWTDTGLGDGTYSYRVVAHRNDDGSGSPCNSDPSNTVTISTCARGDLDGNGRVTVVDLLVLQHTLIGNISPGTAPCVCPDCGDWDGSGELDAGDAVRLAAWLGESELAGSCPGPEPTFIVDLTLRPETPSAEPPARQFFRDPVFGRCLVRVTDRTADLSPDDDSEGLKNEYSRVQSFNADETRILVRSTGGTWYLYDATTLRPIRQVPLGIDPRWDAADPDLIYFSEGTRLLAYDVESDGISLIHEFADDFPGQDIVAVWTRYEGSPTADGRYWGFMAENENWETVALLVYDQESDLIVARRDLPGPYEIDSVCISPLGDFFLAFYDNYCERNQPGSDEDPCGLMVYDADLTNGRSLLRIVGHADLALDAQGREVLVYQDIDEDNLSMLDLATGDITPLLPLDFSGHGFGLHISGRSLNQPGWVVVSTHDGDAATYTWMDDQVFAVELVPGGRVVRLAHTQSVVDENQEHDYWAEPQASANRSLTRILFTTNWGRSGTAQVEMMQLELPADWICRLPF
jgi:hypothetical protein